MNPRRERGFFYFGEIAPWGKVLSVPILRSLAAALGLSGLSAAQDVIRSPWSDSSHLAEFSFEHMYGENAHGLVSRSDAIHIGTVAGVRDVLTGRISRCPLIEYGTDDQPTPANSRPRVLSQPEAGRPRSQTITWTVDEMLFYGRTFWEVTERDTNGKPSRFRLVRDKDVETDDAGQMIRAHGQPVRPVDSVRIDGPHEGLLERGSDVIRRAIRLNRSAAKAEANPVPSIDLHNEGEDPDAQGIKDMLASWTKARENSGVGYSSKGIKVNSLGQHPEQLMIDGRRAITLELLRHMGAGTNPEIVAAAAEGSSLNYTNKASREQALIDNFLAPYMTAIEDRLSMDDIRPHGRYVKFNTDILTRDDTATRYANYKTGKEIGLLTDDDIKKAEGKA